MSLRLSLLGSTASTTVDLGEHCGGSTVAASTAKTFSSAFRAGTGGGLSWWCSHSCGGQLQASVWRQGLVANACIVVASKASNKDWGHLRSHWQLQGP